MDNAILTGGCNCGAVRYQINSLPLTVAACHCCQCRRQSGAAYSINLIVQSKTMSIEGETACWIDSSTESGAPLSREYCPRCGSPIRSVPSASLGVVAVKAGTLDDPAPFCPSLHIWTASKLPWVIIPDDIPQFERGHRPE